MYTSTTSAKVVVVPARDASQPRGGGKGSSRARKTATAVAAMRWRVSGPASFRAGVARLERDRRAAHILRSSVAMNELRAADILEREGASKSFVLTTRRLRSAP